MQSFQLDLKIFHYSLCEIQSIFLFFSSSFFKYFILIFCLLLITNLFKARFERWRLDSNSRAFYIAPSRRRRGRKEEKKRGRTEEGKIKKKKRKGSRVVACGALFGMGFVDFIYLLFFFLNLCMGSRVVACGALFEIGFVRFFFINYFFFLNLCMSCRMWGSIWDGICPILFIY
jgi:hypothetical protein